MTGRKLVQRFSILTLLLCIATLSACAKFYHGFYYGHSRAEWNAMNEIEQHRAKQAYAEVINAKEQGVLGNPRAESAETFVDYSENSHDADDK